VVQEDGQAESLMFLLAHINHQNWSNQQPLALQGDSTPALVIPTKPKQSRILLMGNSPLYPVQLFLGWDKTGLESNL
jgi:hypothetical protein